MNTNRRYFLRTLASGLVAAAAPSLFLPKLVKPGWKVPLRRQMVQIVAGDAANVYAEQCAKIYHTFTLRWSAEENVRHVLYKTAFEKLPDGTVRVRTVDDLKALLSEEILTFNYEFTDKGVVCTTEFQEA